MHYKLTNLEINKLICLLRKVTHLHFESRFYTTLTGSL